VYPYTQPWALAWNYRKRNLLREILSYRADVLALQEVRLEYCCCCCCYCCCCCCCCCYYYYYL
jgi:hypothetical protein